MNDNKNNNNKFSNLKGIHKAVPIILISAAVFIAICLFVEMGTLGDGIRALLRGLFSWGGVLIPVAMIAQAIAYPDDIKDKKIIRRLIFSAVAVVLVSAVDFAISGIGETPAFTPGKSFVNMEYGGFIGCIIGFVLSKLFGQIGVIILAAAVLAIYTTFFYAEKAGSLGALAISVKNQLKKAVAAVADKQRAHNEKKQQLKEDREQHRREVSSAELIDDEFFKAKGKADEIKIKQLGIEENAETHGVSPLIDPAKRIPEEPEPVIIPEKKQRKRAEKPLDLSYGDDEEPAIEKTEESAPQKKEYDNAFFGMDDSADNVFTKDFDPFDFATSEKANAKYASKVAASSAITEELDEFALYEMRANHIPTEREKRMMELERKKKEWLAKNGKTESAAASPAPERTSDPISAPVSTPIPTPAPAVEAKAEASEPVTPSAPTPSPAPISHSAAPVQPKQQPIKSVEFTITKTPAPIVSAPATAPENRKTAEDATEDIAILIGKRVEQSNPGYARSANDLKTYTKVVSDENDELYRQLNGLDSSSEEKAEEAPAEEDTSFELENTENDILNVSSDSENEALPETVEFTIGGEEAPEATAEVVEFKPYAIPTPAVTEPIFDSQRAEETIKVERTMLPPTPAAAVNKTVTQTDAAASLEEIDFTQEGEAELDFEPAEEAYDSEISEDPLFADENDVLDDGEDDDEDDDEINFDDGDGEEDGEADDIEDDETDDIEVDDDEDEDGADTDGESEEDGDTDTKEIPPEEQNPDVIKMREMFPFLAPIGEQKENAQSAPATSPIEESIPENEVDDVPFDEPVQVKIPQASLVPANEKKKEEKKKPDYSDYQFPPLDFLAKQEEGSDDNIQAEIQENADKLIETLASFGVTASIKGVDRGPRITRYEVVPAKGVKVSSILNLQDDIALNLAAGSIRMEAPIPGKSAVGIEIPNKKSSIVRLRNLLETADFEGSKSKTFVCIGRDVAGQPVFGDLAKMPHLLIAGATGMGKSVCINSLLISVLYKARPDEVKLIMIDPKQVEFTMYNGIPHLLVPVVSDAKQAAGALMWAVEEMERRYVLLNSLYVRSVDAYNEKVVADPSLGEFLPKIIIVIDEFADLMLQVKDPVEQLVTRIAQKARAAGIHLVIGTQRPSVNVITGVIKANVPSRISCKVMSNVDSKTVLDSAGAEKLLDKGDSLYAPAGSPKPHRLQCAFVADGEVEQIMKYLQQFGGGNSYDSSVMEDIERAAQKCSKKGGGADRDDDDDCGGDGEGYLNDRQFLDAVEIAVNTRKISTSLIQRKLSIGYGKAAKFIDIMEDMGIVGEPNGQRPREVLLTPDEWREKLARASLD